MSVEDNYGFPASPVLAAQRNGFTKSLSPKPPIIDLINDNSPLPPPKDATVSGMAHPPKLVPNRPSPTIPIPPFLIDASYRPLPLFEHSYPSPRNLSPNLITSIEPPIGPASILIESPVENLRFDEVDSTLNQLEGSMARIIGNPDVGASHADLSRSSKLDISPASAALEEPVVNLKPPSEPVLEGTSTNFDDVFLFEHSRTPITSRTTYTPTIFDSTYYNPRYRDLWAFGEGDQERMRSQMVIAGIRTDIRDWPEEEEVDESKDDIKVEELGKESGVFAGLGSDVDIQDSPSKTPRKIYDDPSQRKVLSWMEGGPSTITLGEISGSVPHYSTGGMDDIDLHAAEDGNVELMDVPELAVRLDQHMVALKSFVKGKKWFQPQVCSIDTFSSASLNITFRCRRICWT